MGRYNALDHPFAVSLAFFSVCFIMYISGASPFLVLKWSILCLVSVGAVLYLLNAIRAMWMWRRERDSSVVVDVTANERKRFMLVEEKQADLVVKSAAYEKRVVEPREKARAKRADEEAMKFSRWKSDGHQLGSLKRDAPGKSEEGWDQLDSLEGDVDEVGGHGQEGVEPLNARDDDICMRSTVLRSPSVDAAEKRRLEVSKGLLHRSLSQGSSAEQQNEREETQERRRVDDDCVIIAMKLPNGKSLQQAFNVTEPVEVLYEWLEGNGWRRKDCDIVSTYPRRIFSNLRQTLMEAGLGSSQRLTLAVEYK